MISCTEFIPCYSELFTYLEEKSGRDEVDRFWKYLFEPDGKGIPLVNYVKKEGIRGCFSYWAGTLNEEAADFTLYLNEKRGYFRLVMHHCPSKGRLLDLQNDIGLVPYHDYCLHCDSYRSAVEKIGLKYIFCCAEEKSASCSILIYDPSVFDGRIIVDKDTEIMERKASDNEYFHKDFHSSMNMGIHYLGEHYGVEGVREYLVRYTKNVYGKVQGLAEIATLIKETYEREKCPDAFYMELDNKKGTLEVNVSYCPAVKHLHETGREVSKWYPYTTEVVMKTLAKESGYQFKMEAYNEESGACKFSFWRD